MFAHQELIGFASSAEEASGPVALSFLVDASSASDLTTYTFSSLSLGTAASNRYILVAVGRQRFGTPSTVSSLTVAGVSASQVVDQGSSNANQQAVSIWIAAVPTGTTGDVVVTLSAGHLRCGVSIFRMVNASGTAHATGGDAVGTTVGSIAINVPANGAALAAFINNGNTTLTWTGVTERTELDVDGSDFGAASNNFTSASTPLTIECTQASDNSPFGMVAASFGPG